MANRIWKEWGTRETMKESGVRSGGRNTSGTGLIAVGWPSAWGWWCQCPEDAWGTPRQLSVLGPWSWNKSQGLPRPRGVPTVLLYGTPEFLCCFVFGVVVTIEVMISLFLFLKCLLPRTSYVLLTTSPSRRHSYSSSRRLEWEGGASARGIPLVCVCPQRWGRGVTSDVPISGVSGPREKAVPPVPKSCRGCGVSPLLCSF